MDVQKLWLQLGEKKVGLIARENGLTHQQLVAMFDQAGLTGRTPSDPSEEEIRRKAKQIREKGFGRNPAWDERVRQRRWIAARLINRNETFAFKDTRDHGGIAFKEVT